MGAIGEGQTNVLVGVGGGFVLVSRILVQKQVVQLERKHNCRKKYRMVPNKLEPRRLFPRTIGVGSMESDCVKRAKTWGYLLLGPPTKDKIVREGGSKKWIKGKIFLSNFASAQY